MMNIYYMILISIIAGFLSSMNMWAVSINHVRLHLNDIYMVTLMTGWMILLETLIYYNHIENAGIILLISLIVIIMTIYNIRNQNFIDDKNFLNGMIPHHSMAILMSDKIKDKTNNPKIKELANGIIEAQQREIKLMDELLKN